MVSERYKTYMRSRAWKQFRARAFAHYGKKCYACGTFRGPIQIHHRSYARFTRERISDVIPLCVPCHKAVTYYHRRNRRNGLGVNTAYIVKMIRAGKLNPRR